MAIQRITRATIMGTVLLGLAACGNNWAGDSNPNDLDDREMRDRVNSAPSGRTTIWDAFGGGADPNVTVQVNKYLWAASLDVLNFLPIESVDPFTGVIVTGYGTPPGGGRSYRATVYIQDPALDARSLRVSLQTSGGGSAAPDTVKAVEDAILTRARQLRVRDGNL